MLSLLTETKAAHLPHATMAKLNKSPRAGNGARTVRARPGAVRRASFFFSAARELSLLADREVQSVAEHPIARRGEARIPSPPLRIDDRPGNAQRGMGSSAERAGRERVEVDRVQARAVLAARASSGIHDRREPPG